VSNASRAPAAQLLHWGVVVVVIGAVAGIASADPGEVSARLNKASAAFAAARLKLLAKCEEAKHKESCRGDRLHGPIPRRQRSLAQGGDQVRSVLDGKCGGAERRVAPAATTTA